MRETILKQKEAKGLTWESLATQVGKSPVYTAMLCYGYGQATEEEADALVKALDLSAHIRDGLIKAPDRRPVQPWPPTDPFVYRFYEVVLLYPRCSKTFATKCLATA